MHYFTFLQARQLRDSQTILPYDEIIHHHVLGVSPVVLLLMCYPGDQLMYINGVRADGKKKMCKTTQYLHGIIPATRIVWQRWGR